MDKPAAARPRAPPRLPSLDLLKGFEAAARQLSFTRAAEELFLTQSALSRQMQTLEEQVGCALFERRHRELRLTDAGQILQAAARTVLGDVAQAVAKIRREQTATPLTVSTNQPFASVWLIPRLARFRARHPAVDVYISADNRIVDLDRERIDLAVRYCTEQMAPPGSARLFGERLLPVCSPELASDRARPLKRPEDLARHVLLHIDDERGRFPWLNWSVWLAANGIDEIMPAGSLRFNHFDQVIQAALDGQGVGLGRVPLIDSLLAQGRLIAPFRSRYATARAYFIVRGTAPLRPDAQAFIDWLIEEAAAEAALDASADAAPARKRRPRR
ncbi:MAG TPA: LysR substrate-binding domain-containing protein [Casimicrobiaceae bacterium]|jgi:DNA-binding transcriptional LysR family regulator